MPSSRRKVLPPHSTNMKINRKKAIQSGIVGVLIAVVPFLFWRTFLRQLPLVGSGEATLSERFEESESPTPTPTPEGQARLRELLPYPATALALDNGTGMLRMYEEGTGRAFEVNPGTLKVFTLSEEKLDDFVTTLWSPNGSEVISLFNEEDRASYRYYDYRDGRVSELPFAVRYVTFSPDGTKIAMFNDFQGQPRIWIAAPDGTNEWLLLATRMDIVALDWPMNETLAITSQNADGSSTLSLLSLDGSLSILLENLGDLDVVWSRSGTRALISFNDPEDGLTLSMFDMETERLTSLPIVSRASKCAWHRNGASATCGVPAQTTSASRDTVMTIFAESDHVVVRYEPPKDVWVGITEPVVLPRDDGIAFINFFDKRPYLITW